MRTRDLPCVKHATKGMSKEAKSIIERQIAQIRKIKGAEFEEHRPNIGSAFWWDETLEGYDYWHNIFAGALIRNGY